uniref:EF-hand domain-containing protein n=1 Tax=Leptobrachium leishanense TaxID=445787 RepID=A0A8C5Q4Q3_9ANUR
MFLINQFGGGGFKASGFIGGLIGAVGEAAANYRPDPPPPRSHFSNVEANESEEVRQFRRLFNQLAGEDMEVCPSELMGILNKVVARHQDLKTDGFSLDSCRSMVAVMDSDSTGKLGFEEFKYLWNNVKKWQGGYKRLGGGHFGIAVIFLLLRTSETGRWRAPFCHHHHRMKTNDWISITCSINLLCILYYHKSAIYIYIYIYIFLVPLFIGRIGVGFPLYGSVGLFSGCLFIFVSICNTVFLVHLVSNCVIVISNGLLFWDNSARIQ